MPHQFPISPPVQMPCPHWNHFPIHPQMPQKFGGAGILNGNGGAPLSPPPSPDSYAYCAACNSARKRTA